LRTYEKWLAKEDGAPMPVVCVGVEAAIKTVLSYTKSLQKIIAVIANERLKFLDMEIDQEEYNQCVEDAIFEFEILNKENL